MLSEKRSTPSPASPRSMAKCRLDTVRRPPTIRGAFHHMSATSASTVPSGSVQPGRWGVVLAGGDRATTALRELCGSYWYPIYTWWRRVGLPAVKATTATQATAARWLGSALPTSSDAGAHHFRAWVHTQLPQLATGGVKLVGPAPLNFDAAWA